MQQLISWQIRYLISVVMSMDMQQSDERPIRVIVEVVSNAEVRRLEGRDDDIRAEVKSLEKRIEGLNRTIYELMEVISKLRSKR